MHCGKLKVHVVIYRATVKKILKRGRVKRPMKGLKENTKNTQLIQKKVEREKQKHTHKKNEEDEPEDDSMVPTC